MPDTTSKVITIALGVETNNPAMADALRRWLVATRGPEEVAREIFKQQRAARKTQRINRHNLNLARRDRRVNQ
jgi:hypothetical protein